jgi:hypothetical protein
MVRDFYVMGVGAVRSVLPTMPILLHDSFHGDLWHSLLKYFPYDDIFMVSQSAPPHAHTCTHARTDRRRTQPPAEASERFPTLPRIRTCTTASTLPTSVSCGYLGVGCV